MDITLDILAILAAIAFVAGFIDAIAGGGGLLTLPALLFAGVSPVQAIATTKFSACFGGFAATRFFIKRDLVSVKQQTWGIIAATLGATLGALALQLFDAKLLMIVLPYGLILIAVYLLFSKSFDQVKAKATLSEKSFNGLLVSGVGFYDGFFGPGAGTFFTLSYCKLRAMDLLRATAHAKLLNFTTNTVALLVFIVTGMVVWKIALVMALGQIVGSHLGAAFAVKKGVTFVRYMTVAVCIAMSVSLLLK
ncbi:hypothetical protein EDC56_0963 [Sinobacterium caligoides]|uniref:Probable membrane transporter protein n=1 Tax=Sinobacterium caligoides TaxID=933926 RepID=A0A3N2DZZ6_9GAMM|nr:TSUP family transporter [Sinobacterium caligoides]ROS05433.1 hypothetical protein EDC56_0963 [Sinobacterium caligoides]